MLLSADLRDRGRGFNSLSISGLTLEELRRFREGWQSSPATAIKKLERLRSFLRFCEHSGWMEKNPGALLKLPKPTQAPTLPFTEEEERKILEACDRYPDNYDRFGGSLAKRIRAFVLLLRYSGLRIGDAACLERKRLQGNRLFLYTAKTGTPVHLPLPPHVVEALIETANHDAEYFFWTGESRCASSKLEAESFIGEGTATKPPRARSS